LRIEMTDESDKILFFNSSVEKVNFKIFAQFVSGGDIEAAAFALRDILGLELKSALKSAEFFEDQLHTNPNLISKMMQIRDHIENGKNNDSLALLQGVFNISVIESIKAFESIKKSVDNDLKN